MEVGVYIIKRNLDFFKVDEEYIYMDFLMTGTDDEVIKNTLYSLAAYKLPMEAVEVYKVAYFDTKDAMFYPVIVKDGVEVKVDDIDFFDFEVDCYESSKILVNIMLYVKTYEYFVEEIKRLTDSDSLTGDFPTTSVANEIPCCPVPDEFVVSEVETFV